MLDPFCGTASILLACAARGAATVGVEIDTRVLHGGDGGRGIDANFEAARLPPPTALLLGDSADLDALLPPTAGSQFERFDAIVTDPPYGLMEGLGELFQPLPERIDGLLTLATRRLRVGGRLVFLLPLPAEADAAEALGPHAHAHSDCLALDGLARHAVSLRMHRLLVTMTKVAGETHAAHAAHAPVATASPASVRPRAAGARAHDAASQQAAADAAARGDGRGACEDAQACSEQLQRIAPHASCDWEGWWPAPTSISAQQQVEGR